MKTIDKVIVIGKIIISCLGVIFAVYGFVILPMLARERKEKFEKVSCCTVAYTIGRTGRPAGIKYVYYVDGVLYEGEDAPLMFSVVRNERKKYLIKYICDNPQDALIYFDKPIEGDTIPAEYLINKW